MDIWRLSNFFSKVPGVDFNAVVLGRNTAFYRAGENGLHLAIQAGYLSLVRFLLSSDLDFDVEARNNKGRLALLFACYYGHVGVVEYLLTTHNVDMLAVNDDGESCFLAATRESELDDVRYLLENYPDCRYQWFLAHPFRLSSGISITCSTPVFDSTRTCSCSRT